MKRAIFVLLLALSTSGCYTSVPTGHVGKVRTVSGFEAKVLGPGLQTCWGRDKMYLMEVSDRQYVLPVRVLCKDQLNFSFEIGVLCSVNRDKSELINRAFENIKPVGSDATISMDQLFEMYVKPTVDQEARRIVSRYETREIATSREEVIDGIRAAVSSAIDDSLMKVHRITVNNLDFPDVITRAQEARAQRQVEILSVQAEAEKEVERAKGQLAVAQIEYERQLIEAAMISDANKIIGASITPGFLAWHELRVLSEAAKGPNNWGFIPYSNSAQKVLATGDVGQMVLDEELLNRIRQAKEKVNSNE